LDYQLGELRDFAAINQQLVTTEHPYRHFTQAFQTSDNEQMMIDTATGDLIEGLKQQLHQAIPTFSEYFKSGSEVDILKLL
jgi:hypothetical protein